MNTPKNLTATSSSFPRPRPLVIAGPCMAESAELLQEVAGFLAPLARSLDFDWIFKASFDKANRTSYNSYRGPGLETTMDWFEQIKSAYGCQVLTDIHEAWQAEPAAKVCDALQIPAFLCRQTDLVVAAAKHSSLINIKKGQFMAPGAMLHIADKALQAAADSGHQVQVSLTERGTSFGYGDLVVDMRSFAKMKRQGLGIIFDVTHSTQQPPQEKSAGVSGALRAMAPLLARSATATGALDGFFIETHPRPNSAKSDAAAQLNFTQMRSLLEQLVPLWHQARTWSASIDSQFTDQDSDPA